jgi:hypothetical protein
MPVLEDLRERRTGLMAEMETLSKQSTLTGEQRSRFDELDKEITELDGELELRERQAERERRAAESRAKDSGGRRAEHDGEGRHEGGGWSVVREPTTYGRGARHSYFLDLARAELNFGDGDGGPTAARDRLKRHAQEIDVEMPKRLEQRRQAADRAYENALMTGNRAERRAAERMLRMGMSPFERGVETNPAAESRFISRVDGAGGYFVPPLWLIDEYIPYLRAGRDFVDLWRGLPLPPGTDSINIPRVTQGTATGPQVADGGPVPGRDMIDNFVNAPVRTIAGQQDAALQLLDQSPVVFDEIIFEDLGEDYNLQLSGQAFLGSGAAGQILGVWPGGTISTTNGVYVANTNNTAAQTWVNGGGASPSVTNSVFQASGQMMSIGARSRLKPFTQHVWHPWVWYYLTTQVDNQMRPLVVPGTPQNVGYNQAAVDTDGPVASGPVGFYQGLPVVLDPNMPVTFGASGVQPSIQTISQGQFAAVPGAGAFTPLLAGRWQDCYLWEGEMRSRVLSEVLSGNLQIRFQVYNYVAAMPNRYQAYTTIQTGTGPTTVAAVGASVSFATLTQFSATAGNSVLNMMAQGF